MYNTLQKINHVTSYVMILVLLSNFATPAYAKASDTTLSGAGNLGEAMKQLCNSARQMLAIGAILLVVLAAVVYAVGQVVGAETRARASVWATAMLTGAIIGMIIYIIVPQLVATMTDGKINSTDPCNFSF